MQAQGVITYRILLANVEPQTIGVLPLAIANDWISWPDARVYPNAAITHSVPPPSPLRVIADHCSGPSRKAWCAVIAQCIVMTSGQVHSHQQQVRVAIADEVVTEKTVASYIVRRHACNAWAN